MKDGGKLTIKSVAILIITGIVAIEWLHGGTILSRAFGLRVLNDILIFLLVAIVLSNWLK